MTTKTRIALTVGFAIALGLLQYCELREIPSQEAAAIALWAVAVGGAVLIRRWWALLAVLGPFLALLILELSGYVTQAYLEWGDRPLASPPGIFSLIAIGAIILLGLALGWFGEYLVRASRHWRARWKSPVTPGSR